MARHQDDEKRQRILEASIATFQEKGFTTTTMKDIAEKAGIAPGSIYTYYQDKDVLFIAAVDTVWKNFYRGLKPIIASYEDFPSQMDAIMDYGFKLMQELHPLIQGMYQDTNRLNLFHKNIVKLSKHLAFYFNQVEPPIASFMKLDQRSRMNFIKVWISGMMFNLASLPENRLESEIQKQRLIILQLLIETRVNNT